MLNKFIFMTVPRIYPTTKYPSLSNHFFFLSALEIMLKPRSDAKGKKKTKTKKLKHKYDKRKKLKGTLEIFCLLGKHTEKCSFNVLLSSSNAASSSSTQAAWSPWKELWQENRLSDLKFWLTTS